MLTKEIRLVNETKYYIGVDLIAIEKDKDKEKEKERKYTK